MTALRLRCQCGRNLADVEASDNEAGFAITARAPMRTWLPPGAFPAWHAVTYGFTCRCGQRPQIRAGVLFDHWSHRRHERGVAICVVGVDL